MKLLKAGKIITLVLEVLAIIGMVLCPAAAVMAFVNPRRMLENGTFRINGIEITKPLELLENPSVPMCVIFLAGAAAACLMALMMHRMHGIIVETMVGKPFQPCTVKWIRQIGYCAVSMPLVSGVMGLVAMFINVDGIHATLDLSGLLMGVLMLCLTHVFACGLELQKDVDGLL